MEEGFEEAHIVLFFATLFALVGAWKTFQGIQKLFRRCFAKRKSKPSSVRNCETGIPQAGVTPGLIQSSPFIHETPGKVSQNSSGTVRGQARFSTPDDSRVAQDRQTAPPPRPPFPAPTEDHEADESIATCETAAMVVSSAGDDVPPPEDNGSDPLLSSELTDEEQRSLFALRGLVGAIRANQTQADRLNKETMSRGLEVLRRLVASRGSSRTGGDHFPTSPTSSTTALSTSRARVSGRRNPTLAANRKAEGRPLGSGGLLGTMVRRRQEIRERKAQERHDQLARQERQRQAKERSSASELLRLVIRQQQLALEQSRRVMQHHSRLLSPAMESYFYGICDEIKWGEPTVEVHNEECPVCLVPFAHGCEMKVLPCKHGGCTPCLDSWFKITQAVFCPVCRGKFSENFPGE